MINGLRLILCGASLIFLAQTYADTAVLPNQQDDPNGTCGSLMQLADTNPPQGSADPDTINSIQTCLADCNQLYQWYADQNQYDEMSAGISYCRSNLTALYNQSIFLQANNNLTQTTNDTVSTTNVTTTRRPSLLEKWLHNDTTEPTINSNTSNSGSSSKQSKNNANQSEQKQVNWF